MSTLMIHFEGYWQCRQATDPDPSKDPRGASGYTFAVGNESDLDQIIRLQRDEIPDQDFRPAPEPHYPKHHPTGTFGVFVTDVTLDGRRYQPGFDALHKGCVRWLPIGDPNRGPRFELRNTITYYPVNGIFMPIIPFHIRVESSEGEDVVIERDDPLDPSDPDKLIWQISDHKVYARRCPSNWFDVADDAMDAIGVEQSTLGAFFQQRKEWLQLQLSNERDPVQREAYQNRLYVIHFFSSQKADGRRLETRLSAKAEWAFDLQGDQIIVLGERKLGGQVDTSRTWQVEFWMGGFDGDLMRGYMRGTLRLPFIPAAQGTSTPIPSGEKKNNRRKHANA